MKLEENVNLQSALKAGLAISIPFVGAAASCLPVAKEARRFFESLKKPSWTPSEDAQGINWTIAYGTLGAASYLVWRDGGGFSGRARTALALYGSTLILIWTWPQFFARKRNLKLALIDSVLTTGAGCATAVLFYQINHNAGYLALPFCAWMAFATAVNYHFYKDNKDVEKSV